MYESIATDTALMYPRGCRCYCSDEINQTQPNTYDLRLLTGNILQSTINLSFTENDPLIIEVRPSVPNSHGELFECKRHKFELPQEHVLPKRAKYTNLTDTVQICTESNVDINQLCDDKLQVSGQYAKDICSDKVQEHAFLLLNELDAKNFHEEGRSFQNDVVDEKLTKSADIKKSVAFSNIISSDFASIEEITSMDSLTSKDRLYEFETDSHTFVKFRGSADSEDENQLSRASSESYTNLIETTGISVMMYCRDEGSLRKSSIQRDGSEVTIEKKETKISSTDISQGTDQEIKDNSVISEIKEIPSREDVRKVIRDSVVETEMSTSSLSTDKDDVSLAQIIWENLALARSSPESLQQYATHQIASEDEQFSLERTKDSEMPHKLNMETCMPPEKSPSENDQLKYVICDMPDTRTDEKPLDELLRYAEDLSNQIISPVKTEEKYEFPIDEGIEPLVPNSWQDSFLVARFHQAYRLSNSRAFETIEIKNKIEERIVNSSLILACLEITRNRINEN